MYRVLEAIFSHINVPIIPNTYVLCLFYMHKGTRSKKKTSRGNCAITCSWAEDVRAIWRKNIPSGYYGYIFIHIYVCTFWINCMPLNTHVRELNNPVTYLISTLFPTLNYSKNIRKFSMLVPQKRKKHKSNFPYFDFLFFIRNGLKHFHIISCEFFIKKTSLPFCFSFPFFPLIGKEGKIV